jgi:hypothetical protein
MIMGGVGFVTTKLPFLPWHIVIIPHGPIPANPDAVSWLPLMEHLDKLSRDGGAIFAQLYPHESKERTFLVSRLERLGFWHAAILDWNFSSIPVAIDLTGKTEVDILSSCRKNTRYYVRKALSGKLVLKTDVDDLRFDKIYNLFAEHGQLMGYRPKSRASLKAAWDWFSPLGQANLFQAWLDQTLIGAIFVVFTGKTGYYLAGAVKREFKEHHPAEFLQWHAILESVRRKFNTYDLVNTWPPGVRSFKEGFRPRIHRWHAPRVKLYRPTLSSIVRLGDQKLRPMLGALARLRMRQHGETIEDARNSGGVNVSN